MASRPLNTASLFRAEPGRVWPGLAATLADMVRALRTRRELSRLDARLLRDIGITPGDAAREAGRAPWDLR
jgi:uncharacterized protein YjiS (DUF1127 family)